MDAHRDAAPFPPRERQQHRARTSGAPPDHNEHPAADIRQRLRPAPAVPARPGIGPGPARAHPDRQTPHRADYRAGKNPDHIVARVGPVGQTWRALRYCLQDESLRQAIEALRPRQARTASVLRLLDVALRMLHSESTAARNARAAASVTPQR